MSMVIVGIISVVLSEGAVPGASRAVEGGNREEGDSALPAANEPPPSVHDGAPDADALARTGWHTRVGANEDGLWVSVPRQMIYLIRAGEVHWSASCATAALGMGARQDSYQTPPGWHRIARKIGEGEPAGRVFRGRVAQDEIWRPGDPTEEDLVLTRVFVLEGLEEGVNRGQDSEGFIVDSRKRYIYIHGTNDEVRLGVPSSHGCIRISNKDAIALFEIVSQGTLLYIAP